LNSHHGDGGHEAAIRLPICRNFGKSHALEMPEARFDDRILLTEDFQ
jgi:hypothetical protein